MTKKDWYEFRDSGLLWWINRTLHLFGWAIVYEVDDITKEIVSVYPARVKFRGFPEYSEEQGYQNVTKHLEATIQELVKEVKNDK